MSDNIPNSPLDILLMGRTGNGKSATGNSILMKEAFTSNANVTSLTVIGSIDYSEFQGRALKVVDSPGLGDNRLGVVADVKQFVDAVKFAIAMNPGGYHAILYVIKYGDRYSKEDVETLKHLKKIMGNDFIRNHGILVLTRGDSFESDPEVKRNNLSVKDWVAKQDEPNFKELVSECNKRVILFDNRTVDQERKEHQITNLITMIDKLSKNGLRYTNKEFQQAERERERLMRKLERPYLKDEHIKELALITSCFSKIGNTHGDDDDDLEKLKKLSMRAQELHLHILEDDKNTGLLQSSIVTVCNTKSTIDLEIAKKDTLIYQRKQREEEKRRYEEKLANLEKEKAEFEALKKLENEKIMKMKEEEARIARQKLEEKEEEERKRVKEKQEQLKEREEEMRQQEMKRIQDMLAEAEETKRRAAAMEREYQELKKNESCSQGFVAPLFNYIGSMASGPYQFYICKF